MNTPRYCITLLFLCALTACATTSTDPREGGLAGGISGLSSGAYDERVREREDRLAELRATQAALDAESRELEAAQAERQRLVDAERAELARLNADIETLHNTVEGLSAQLGETDARVVDIQQRLAQLQRDMADQQSSLDALEGTGIGDTDEDLRRRQLIQQRDALRREFDLLMELSLELAR